MTRDPSTNEPTEPDTAADTAEPAGAPEPAGASEPAGAAPEPSGTERTVLVTGASSGIGRATAAVFAEAGYRVLGTCRRPDSLAAADRVPGVRYLPLDLASLDSVEECAAAAGAVDVLVNNAGQSRIGAAEETSPAALQEIFAVNVLGTIRLTQLLLPGMRERGRGSIIMVGSLLAEFPLPFRSAYVASKAALRGFTLAAREEVRPFGIRMSIIEPAYYRTGITGNRIRDVPPGGSVYARGLAAVEAGTAKGDARGGDPADVARRILAIARNPDPAPVYAVGRTEPYLLQLRRLLSNRAVERLMARRYGLRG